jgi:hypothetical protein
VASIRDRIETSFTVDGQVQREDLFQYMILLKSSADERVFRVRKSAIWLGLFAGVFLLFSLGFVNELDIGPFVFSSIAPMLFILVNGAAYLYLETIIKGVEAADRTKALSSTFRLWNKAGWDNDLDQLFLADPPFFFPVGQLRPEGSIHRTRSDVWSERIAGAFFLAYLLLPLGFFIYAYVTLFREGWLWAVLGLPFTLAAVTLTWLYAAAAAAAVRAADKEAQKDADH